MEEKKLYLGLGALAVIGILVTSALVYKASKIGTAIAPSGEEIATESAVPQATEEAVPKPRAILADLVLDFGEATPAAERIASFSAVKSSKGTALDLLLTAASENNFGVDYEEQSFGAFIKSIVGVENSKDTFWMFYVNGRMAPVAADKQKIEDGDRVEFRYERMEAE